MGVERHIGPPLLVGEQNPHSRDPRHALLPWPAGAAGHRLRVILGMTDREYLGAFDRANLLGRGRWSAAAARAAAARLLVDRRGSTIVMLGARVAAAFGAGALPEFESTWVSAYGVFHNGDAEPRRCRLVRLPHPSGRCRSWNDPGAIGRARTLVADVLSGRR